MSDLPRHEGRVDDDPMLERVARTLAEDSAPQPGDSELLGRAVAAAMKGAPATATPLRRAGGYRTWLLAAAALVVLAGFASAAWRARAGHEAPEPPLPVPAALAPTAPASPALPAEPTAAIVDPSPAPRAPVAPAPAVGATPAAIFARANEARRRSDPAAVGLYLDLQHRFPRSAEARLSQVTLGRLYLDRLDEAASALAQFDAYVAGGGGELEEEALVGRALALQRMGRSADERRAWERLIAKYPDSISGDRARRRMAELP